MSRRTMIAWSLLLAACSDGNETRVSAGPKIFITAEKHIGNFADDASLTGTTAIQKADSFCNQSAGRPSNATYKALLVDGTTRDAVSMTDWVLKPGTTYYRSFNNVPIGTTTGAAIFDVVAGSLANSIFDCGGDCDPITVAAWTGIEDVSTFAAGNSFDTCVGWSSPDPAGRLGSPIYTDSHVFRWSVVSNCGTTAYRLYCVEQ